MSSRVQTAIQKLQLSHGIVREYIEDLSEEEWFWMPGEEVTHIGWQVGHMALCRYGLLLKRVRGDKESDQKLFDLPRYSEQFGRGSKPVGQAELYPSGTELSKAFSDAHEQAIGELKEQPDELLDVALEQPHPAFKTKLEAVEFCSLHEMLHAGQVALLRRLLGREPRR